MVTFQVLSSNIDVMIEIFKYLNAGDQLKLASASAHLNQVYKTYVWPQKYEKLKISEKSYDYLVANETGMKRLCLNAQGLQEFQRLYASSVRALKIQNIVIHMKSYYGQEDAKQGRLLHKYIIELNKFENLKSLTYHYMSIPNEHLNDIVKYMLGLEEFSLINCSLDVSMNQVVQGVVSKMKNLKKLCLYNTPRFNLMYGRFRDIICLKNLEQLELTAVIDFSESSNKLNKLHTSCLKELKIQVSINSLTTLYKYPVSCFGNLISLTIEHFRTVNENTLVALAHSCKQLENIVFRKTIFCNITTFSMPNQVKDLSLISCRGLTYQHLRIILTQLKITKFQSIQTFYDGMFESFQISPWLKCLNIDEIYVQDVKFLHEHNNLEELTLHYLLSGEDENINTPSFASCTGLKMLSIRNGHLPLNNLLLMQNLQTLTMPQPITAYGWSYIMELLKHTSLTVLKLKDHYFNSYRKIDSNVPIQAFETTIEDLTIPLEIFDVGLDFWLQLWNLNKSLKRLCFTCYPYVKYDKVLKALVQHPAFPKKLKSIYICGFAIHCSDLKTNFDVTMEKLQRQTDYVKCWYDGNAYRVELLRP